MLRKALLLILLAVWAAPAAGETVYLRDGRKLVGKVTREDGKVSIEMELGTVVVSAEDVIYISKASGGARTRPSEAPAPGPMYGTPGVSIEPSVVWEAANVTIPDASLFVTARKIEALAGLGEDLSLLTQQLGQWRIWAHDRRRKVGDQWLTRQQQRHRRDQFLKGLEEGNDLLRQARYVRTRSPADETRKKQMQAKADAALSRAARAWPDTVLREFLSAAMDLEAGKYGPAASRFGQCTQAEPLIAAYHQGRGLALLKSKQHLRALEEFIACVQLRDDTWDSVDLMAEGMKAVPGQFLNEPIFLKAKELVERYEKPKQKPRRYGTDIPWLLPGRIRRTRGQPLFALPYDRIVARQALGVPIAEKGMLAVDADALTGAELIYVRLGRGLVVRAAAGRKVSGRVAEGVPLATVIVRDVDFKPVDPGKPAALKAGQEVTVRSVNVYRQMGTEISARQAQVAAGKGGAVAIQPALQPGEPAGAVFSEDGFAGFLSGRCDVQKDDFGKSTLLKPADVAAWAKSATRSSRFGSSYSRGPALKKDLPRQSAEGQVFLVHILVAEEPPKTLGK